MSRNSNLQYVNVTKQPQKYIWINNDELLIAKQHVVTQFRVHTGRGDKSYGYHGNHVSTFWPTQEAISIQPVSFGQNLGSWPLQGDLVWPFCIIKQFKLEDQLHNTQMSVLIFGYMFPVVTICCVTTCCLAIHFEESLS